MRGGADMTDILHIGPTLSISTDSEETLLRYTFKDLVFFITKN
jgi:hypothetical protein